MGDDRRLIEWIDLTADFLQRPCPEFPRAEIAWQLNRTFDVLAVSCDWRDDQGHADSQIWPEIDVSPVADMPYWHQDDIIQRHPLVRWFVATQDPMPQSIGRVPSSRGLPTRPGAHCHLPRSHWRRPPALHPVPAQWPGLWSVRPRSARRRLLRRRPRARREAAAPDPWHLPAHSLVGQVPTPTDTCVAAAHAGLTATELAVLLLLSEGHTAYTIGRRLAMSPRTAQKHLEHIYRKLGVTDRLRAVLTAREGGLLPNTAAPTPGVIPEQRTPI